MMQQRGFSLLELVMVLTLMGILVVLAGPRWPGRVFLHAQATQLAQDMRYTQALAMTQDKAHTIQWVSADSYGIVDSEGNQIAPYPLVLAGVVIESFSISFNDSTGAPASSYPPVSMSREGETIHVTVTDLTGTVMVDP